MTSIRVDSASPYSVFFGSGMGELFPHLRDATPSASRYLIIHQPALADSANDIAARIEDSGGAAKTFQIEDAEDGKTVASAESCWNKCAEFGLTRHDCIISVGGGAATDLGGFIAATWMRGIKVIHVPTTLLGMVDAAIGGKTGINTAAGKNLVGAFHEPSAVLVDLDVLLTLPKEELVAGSAEIVKAGFIRDTSILEIYEKNPVDSLDPAKSVLPELIKRAIQVKADVVAQDLRESHLREILNYGHTFGHAVEQQEKYQWRHGQAVGVGMMYEAELAKAAGFIDQELVNRHRRILESIGLATTYQHPEFSELVDVMGRDKKNFQSTIRFVVLEGAGQPTRLEGPSDDLLEIAWQKIQPTA